MPKNAAGARCGLSWRGQLWRGQSWRGQTRREPAGGIQDGRDHPPTGDMLLRGEIHAASEQPRSGPQPLPGPGLPPENPADPESLGDNVNSCGERRQAVKAAACGAAIRGFDSPRSPCCHNIPPLVRPRGGFLLAVHPPVLDPGRQRRSCPLNRRRPSPAAGRPKGTHPPPAPDRGRASPCGRPSPPGRPRPDRPPDGLC